MGKGGYLEVLIITIDEESAGQRLDNYLFNQLKGVPSSRIYRAVRKGEVRVNRARIQHDYRLKAGDQVRLPPLRVAEAKPKAVVGEELLIALELRILYEDEGLIIISKPSGIPVHGGTGIHTGLIEALRTMRPQARVLELVHRLDRETSGCLMIAKKRRVLVLLHRLLTERKVDKQYLTLVKGRWQGGARQVELPLLKNVLKSGERMVTVSDRGKSAVTRFRPIKIFDEVSLIEAKPLTGRTHQIRVHAAHLGYPIAGDEKYGDKKFNQSMRKRGLKRLFLHSASIGYQEPESGRGVGICAVLDNDLLALLARLR